jgi:2-polyprenyl-6-methoxyphenol hydroxylase-like FAD-dependent oxidoreductase
LNSARILVIGGGIGGLTAAIALRQRGFEVEVIEKDPDWAVYGVGIIQQSNVVRAMDQLGLLDDYLGAAFGFDHVDVFGPDGRQLAHVPSPKLVDGRPANLGVARPALHKVLGDRVLAAGARVRLGVTARQLEDDGAGVDARFSDGSTGRYDLVVGADGVNSDTRSKILPEGPSPEFTGQGVWRYNFPRPAEVDCLKAYEGAMGMGLVPLSQNLMYMYVTTPEPGNPRYPRQGLAAAMRSKLDGAAPALAELARGITDDEAVVYKPLDCILLTGPWHRGRIVLLGDAVHATTPHLGQGAGMAIEDGVVLADELAKAASPEEAFTSYRERRFERCALTVRLSRAICDGQLGKGPPMDTAKAAAEMAQAMARPI